MADSPDVDSGAQGGGSSPDVDSSAQSGGSSSKGDSRWKAAAKAGGASLSKFGQQMMEGAREGFAEGSNRPVMSFKRGGKVKRTGLARVHKGEEVVPREKVKKLKKAKRAMKRKGMRDE